MSKEFIKSNEVASETNLNPVDIEQRIYAFINSGALLELAEQRGVDVAKMLESSQNVDDVLKGLAEALKPTKDSHVVRWIEQENLPDLTSEQTEVVFGLADQLGMRQPLEQPLPEVDNPVCVVESGANKTSVVRRGLAEQMLGEEGGTFYQFGSSERVISKLRADGTENPEYKVLSGADVCGELDGSDITEFEANLKSALNSGYEITQQSSEGVITLEKENRRLNLFPAVSFVDGLENLSEKGVLSDQNVVVATNGQYRPKATLQAGRVIGGEAASITAIGDETGKRSAKIYLAEIAVILRELTAELPKLAKNDEREEQPQSPFGSKQGDVRALLDAFDALPADKQEEILEATGRGEDVPFPESTNTHLVAQGIEQSGGAESSPDALRKAQQLESASEHIPDIKGLLAILGNLGRGEEIGKVTPKHIPEEDDNKD